MLIGCITGPDFETAKSQILKANRWCDGVELRVDYLKCSPNDLKPFIKGVILITNKERITCDQFTISTYHNFDHTPSDLDAILEKMPRAAIYKIATYAKTSTDALRMLKFTKEHPQVAGMCMGPCGEVTRILAPVVSSPLTFAFIDKPLVSGQVSAETLQKTYFYSQLNPNTQLFGLIGEPIVHSPSHVTHNAFFHQEKLNAVYVKMPVNKEELTDFLPLAKEFGFVGLSVTMPLKEAVIPYVETLDDEAKQIGAVNTLCFSDTLEGYNTDGVGALDALGAVEGKRIVILGAGGAAKAIAHEAKKRKAHISLHSRRFNNLDAIPDYDILINTTPHPCPIDLKDLKEKTIVMDITLKHKETPLLQRAKDLGCSLIPGEKMFMCQAHEQFAIWARTLSV